MKRAHRENAEPTWEFFNLQEDLHELLNVYNNPRYTLVILEMKTELIKLRKEIGDKGEQFPVMKEMIKYN